jgi:hypothetical protein
MDMDLGAFFLTGISDCGSSLALARGTGHLISQNGKETRKGWAEIFLERLAYLAK